MRAVVTNPGKTPRLTIGDAPDPVLARDEALVKVEAFSMNAGETRAALAAANVYTPGWDFAGLIEEAAADGSGFPAGTRVFGFTGEGSWAQYVRSPARLMARIPEGMTIEQSSALPVAGLTALDCLELAGPLLGRRVLVTGAAGGVGRYACQLASLAGADVHAISRRPDLPDKLRADGVAAAAVFPDMRAAKAAGEYDVIVDSIGGETLGLAMSTVASGGVVINCGNSANVVSTFDVREFYLKGHVRLHGVYLGLELARDCSSRLARLAGLVAAGDLKVPLAAVLPWADIDDAAARLTAQSVDGKIVLTL
jgi:NADPH:quinone reductase